MMQDAIVALVVASAALWTAWNLAVPKSAKLRLAGWVQVQALRRGRSRAGRNVLLKLADHLAPSCCQGKE